jgi:EAL domain-containing protein (putative c-di-GMP-specific phosphodiesterase class I)
VFAHFPADIVKLDRDLIAGIAANVPKRLIAGFRF